MQLRMLQLCPLLVSISWLKKLFKLLHLRQRVHDPPRCTLKGVMGSSRLRVERIMYPGNLTIF